MTIKVETGKSEIYAGPYTVGTVLGIPFTFLKPEHIHVLRNATELSPTSEFIVEGDSIRLLIPIASNETVTIYRATPVDNDADFPQESKFPSEKIADAIDKLTMQNQEQAEALDRALKFSRNIDPDLVNRIAFPESNPGKGIKWNDEGVLANTDEDIDNIVEAATYQANIAKDSAALASQEAAVALEASARAEKAVEELDQKVEDGKTALEEHTELQKTTIDSYVQAAEDQVIANTQDIVDTVESWAVGTIEERPEGSAKYWAEVSKEATTFDTYTKSEIDGALSKKQDAITAGAGIVKSGSTLSIDNSILVTEEEFNQFKTLNSAEINAKQETLTAGTGISIVGNVISATGGGGGGGVSVDAYSKTETDALLSTKQDTLSAGSFISIEGDTVSCTLETYNQTEIQGLLAVKQNTLTAGEYISIVGNTISATPEDMVKSYTEDEWAALSDDEKAGIKLAVIIE
jgi:hypothetical protein